MNAKTWLVLAGLVGLAFYGASSGHHNAEPTQYAAVSTYAAPSVAYAPPIPPPPTTYVVVYGDTLYNIAAAHHVTLGALIRANGFADSLAPINPGDVLQLPTPTDTSPAPSPNVTPASASVKATTAPTYQVSTNPSPNWAATCPNGSCYGEISGTTGNPKTTYVRPHTDKNGRSVGGYYRSHR